MDETRRNAVSSTTASAPHRIAPFTAGPDPVAAFSRLRRIIDGSDGATVVEAAPDYLYATFRSRWLGFVDDAEFHLDRARGVIDVRSASRLGRRDFGVNRARIEAIRHQLSEIAAAR